MDTTRDVTHSRVEQFSFPARRLKYVATINDDVLPESTEPGFELEYVDIGNVGDAEGIRETTKYSFSRAPSRARRLVRHGDTIVSTVRTYLKAIAPILSPVPNLVVSTGFAVVRPQSNVLLPGFSQWALREPSFLAEVEARSVGVSYPAINSSDLACISIPIPPLETQHAIADFLDAETARINALIAAKENLLAILAEKRRVLVTQAVTRGLDPSVPMRDSGIPWLGEIPAHWKARRIATLFQELDVRGKPELPLLSVSINHGVIVREFNDSQIERVAADFAKYKVVEAGQLSFNKMRMWQGAVGFSPADGLVSPDYVVAEPIAPLVRDFFAWLFRSPMMSAEFARHSHGIVWDRLRLYWEGFKNVRVPCPPLREQHEIAASLNKVHEGQQSVFSAIKNSVVLLRERREAVIAAAVTGQLDVEVA